MLILLTIIHVIVCLFLIIVVLLQSGKAADLAGAFGGMGSQTAFGPRGAATVLSKATTIAAALFMVGSLVLSVLYTRMGSQGAGTVLEKAPVSAPKQAPAKAPGTVPIDVETSTGQKGTVNFPITPDAPKGSTQKSGQPAKK